MARPKKVPTATKIATELGAAEEELNQILPEDVQQQLEPVVTEQTVTAIIPSVAQDLRDDYDFARTNLHSLLQKGTKLLDNAIALSEDSEAPRTFEVAGGILKTLIDGNRELMTLHKDLKDVQKKSAKDERDSEQITIEHAEKVENVVVEATTQEILKYLEAKRKGQIEE